MGVDVSLVHSVDGLLPNMLAWYRDWKCREAVTRKREM